ncbi:MAG: hypothetical protein WC529_03865 [Candidatus Margulisiibacteriota bacterium]
MARRRNRPRKKIWFILGLSGAGKTHFSNFLAAQHDFLHLNIDENGIDSYGLEQAWALFEQKGSIEPLISAITARYRSAKKAGAVLSFTSVHFIPIDKIRALKKVAIVAYLFGGRQKCRDSFLRREETEQRLPPEINKAKNWNIANRELLGRLAQPIYRRYMAGVFRANGDRKTPEALYNEINGRGLVTLGRITALFKKLLRSV